MSLKNQRMNNLIELPQDEIITTVLDDIKTILRTISFGSIEIVVQDGVVTQISTRYIRKTNFIPKKKKANNTFVGAKNGISEKIRS